jgi:hypothetical protein
MLLGNPARAQAPSLYYAWRALDTDVAACLDRASTVLTTQQLGNVQVAGNSVAGTTDSAIAMFVCLTEPTTAATTVMIMVSSPNDDEAFQLRETLKDQF